MLLGLIADIHGNLPALEAVLSDLTRENVDRLLCLGDVGIGPQPVETLERIQALGCPVIMGNWDATFLGQRPSFEPDIDPALEQVLVSLGDWASDQLSPAHRQFIETFEEAVEVELGDSQRVLAFHGSPRSYGDSIVATTTDEELERMLDGRSATVLAAAHTHFQLFRRVGESILLNPGSVGLPFRRSQRGVKHIAPWAEYGLVGSTDGRLAVELRRTDYDVERFLRTMAESGMPNADWWIELWADEDAARAEPSAVPTQP